MTVVTNNRPVKPARQAIGDDVGSMLQEEVVYVCPLGISKECEKFEGIRKPFTDHHINGDPSVSEYWNLIRLCELCHKEIHDVLKNNGTTERQVKLKKKNLALLYFGPVAVNVLRLAYKYGSTSAMPAMAMKLLEKDYLKVVNPNTMTVGTATHFTFQDYGITPRGKDLIENLIGDSALAIGTFLR
jgi:hypothetical protein